MYPKKIALFMHGIEAGVFTRLGAALIRGFKQMGISDCDLVVLNATSEEKSWYPDINIVSLNVKHATYALLPLARYLRDYNPDVIFPMPWYFNVIAIWARRLAGASTKVIMTEHNVISLEASIEHRNQLKLRYLPLVMRYSYPFGHGVIGVAQDVLTDLVEQVKVSPHIPMAVIPNTVDIEQIQRLAHEPISHPWFDQAQAPVILTVARLAKQKRLDILIRAFSQVLKTMEARLLILGKGPLRTDLESLCQELQIDQFVSMPGYVPNPYGFMARCGVFVLTSAWEGCPIALQEAFACGAATIVPDSPGGAKDLVDYGKYGMVVPAGDPKILAETMVKILQQPDLQQHYRQRALQRSHDFQSLTICKQYLDFYEAVCS